MESRTARRRPCFLEEHHGLASLADMETGFSRNHLISRPLYYSTKTSNTSCNLTSLSPRSASFHPPHFLDACSLCNKPIADNRDIFMYRGDHPFCSEECRQEEIEKDEAKEKKLNLSASVKAMRKKDQNKSASPNKHYPFRTGAVAAA